MLLGLGRVYSAIAFVEYIDESSLLERTLLKFFFLQNRNCSVLELSLAGSIYISVRFLYPRASTITHAAAAAAASNFLKSS